MGLGIPGSLDRARAKAYVRLLPLLFLCYAIAYVDRINVSLASLRMTEDLPGFDNAVIGFGVGISQGYATLGQIGFAERMDYTAIGTVCNLAARLCGEAKDGQILISRRVAVAVEDAVPLEELGEVSLRGLSQPVVVYNVMA